MALHSTLPMAAIRTKLDNLRKLLGYLPRVLAILWSASPGQTAALGLLTILQSCVPAASIWITKLLVDAVTNGLVQGQNTLRQAVWYTLLFFAVQVLAVGVGQLAGLLHALFNERVNSSLAIMLMEKAGSFPGIATFESPEFYNQMRVIQNEGAQRTNGLLHALFGLVRTAIVAASLLTMTARFHPVIPLAMGVLAIPRAIVAFRLQKKYVDTVSWQSVYTRRKQYFQSLLMSDFPAKEIRIHNLSAYFTDQYQAMFRKVYGKIKSIQQTNTVWMFVLMLAGTAVNALAVVWVVRAVVQNHFTVGDLTLFIQTSGGAAASVESMVGSTAGIFEALLFAGQLVSFLDTKPDMTALPQATAQPVPHRIQRGIVFRNVGFTYQGGREVLRDFTLTLKPGEVVAVVGPNGSGKTTLVKLLCRLYDPTHGAILVDGVDLRELDLEAWRKQFSVVFQDFMRYQMSVRENIGLGHLDDADDDRTIRRAAVLSGADAVAGRLPLGYEQQLGRQYDLDGTELSGGEWQKLALARAFMRAGQLVICDEPTAALDPQAESDLHEQIRQLSKGKITLIISHRLSTVKMADRIIVMDSGSIVEQGSHRDLMSARGQYARLYKLQADKYA